MHVGVVSVCAYARSLTVDLSPAIHSTRYAIYILAGAMNSNAMPLKPRKLSNASHARSVNMHAHRRTQLITHATYAMYAYYVP